MKPQITLCCLLFCCYFLIPILSETDNPDSQNKGDFKIFYIGDSQELCQKKLISLVGKNEVISTSLRDDRIFFYTRTSGFNVFCRLSFYKDQLCQIEIDTNYEEHNIADFLEQIKPMFIKNYGQPFKESQMEGDLVDYTEWNLPGKAIITGIASSEAGSWAVVLIRNQELFNEKKQTEVISKFQTTNN